MQRFPFRVHFFSLFDCVTLVTSRHIIDFVTIVPALAELNDTVYGEMKAFVERELQTPHWMRALSFEVKCVYPRDFAHPVSQQDHLTCSGPSTWLRCLFLPSYQDKAAPESDRKDHGPWGSYDGWLGETVHAYASRRDYGAAADVLRRAAPVYLHGPGGQSHQVFGRNASEIRMLPAKAHADQQVGAWGKFHRGLRPADKLNPCLTPSLSHKYFATSGGVLANHLIASLFSVVIPTETNFSSCAEMAQDKAFPMDKATPRSLSGRLANVNVRGCLFNVTSSSGGLSAQVA